ANELETLELPKLTLGGLVRHFGPGMILMMTGIGTSHLVTAPVAGGRFAYALLWCIPVAYVFKYYGFEMAFRFTHATGRSMLDGYATAWKQWPLWYVLVTTLLQCAIGQAGRLVAVSAVFYLFFTVYIGLDIPIWVYGLLLGTLSVVIILGGKYAAVELVTKISAGILVLSSIVVYLVKPAPFSSMGRFFVFETPQGSWLIIAAFLGLLPTGIDVSLQASEWGKAKKVGMGRIREHLENNGLAKAFDPFVSSKEDLSVDTSNLPPHALEYCRRWFKIGLWDFRLGYVVSFFTACVFLLLAAVWLYPSAVQGTAVMGEIAKIFTRSFGPWMMIIFLVGAFAATFSTAFNYFDGWPRVVGACCRNLFKPTARLRGTAKEDLTAEHRSKWYSEYNIYRMTMLFSLVAAVSMIAGAPRPVWLVLVASALAFFIAPVVFYLNLYYCFSVIPKDDKVFYPSAFATWFGWGSLVIFTGLSAILIMARVFGIELFGA
ncbi:Nramp family divalent metal transporter, partial [Acidobacteria bacterium AH-259-O06]|nr:Nramp family divalent metal transporter [Acidobacteria bacterium AH-259-O06]